MRIFILIETSCSVFPPMSALSRFDEACNALAEAKDLSEVKDIADKATALKEYARRAKDKQLEVGAAELRLRAERRLGQMMNTLGLSSGRPKRNGFSKNPLPLLDGTIEPPAPPATLAEMNIDKNLANRARRHASIQDAEFERRVALGRERALRDHARVGVNLLRTDRNKKHNVVRDASSVGSGEIALPKGQYGAVLLDPEWLLTVWSEINKSSKKSASASPKLQQLKKLKLGSIGAANCILFMWASSENLSAALWLMSRWGFKYFRHCVWEKQSTRSGFPFREAHELLLLGKRGDVEITEEAPWSSLIHDPIPPISGKPDWQYELVDWALPNLTKLDLTGSSRRPGWDIWSTDSIGCAGEIDLNGGPDNCEVNTS
jgi:N6-adenosine-specific RNA methylase IME4